MKNIVFCAALAMGLGAIAFSSASAQEAEEQGMESMIVIVHKGYAELMSDLEFVGEVSGNDDLSGGVQGLLTMLTGGAKLEGLDEGKPWGLSVATDGVELQILAFLPVNDLDKFLEVLGSVGGAAQEEGEGTYRFDVIGQSLYVKQKGDWTYASISPDFLSELPDDPSGLLKGIDQKHDLVARVNVANIPEVFRQLATAPIQQQIEQIVERLPGGGENQPIDLQRMILERIFDGMSIGMNDVESIDLGASIERSSRLFVADYTVRPLADSEMAKKQAATAATKTKFAGFLVPGATAAMNIHMELTKADTLQFTSFVGDLREQLNEQIEGVGAIPEGEVKDVVKELFNQLLTVLDSTASEGHVDAGLALVGEGPYTLVAGAESKEAHELQKFCERIADLLENQLGFYGFQLDADKHEDVRFHTVAIPLPGGDIVDQLIELFGFDLELTFGVGENRVFAAMGSDGVEHLKKIIDQSAADADKDLPPLQIHASMAPLMKVLAGGPNVDPSLSALASGLEPGKDKLTIVTTPIEGGMHTHLEAQEGLIKVVSALLAQYGPALVPQLQ